VTTAVTAKLIAQGRIGADELTVVCITGNGLKTTDALAGRFAEGRAVKPRLAEFDAYLREIGEIDGSLAGGATEEQELVTAGGAR
jgi:threonine synthase